MSSPYIGILIYAVPALIIIAAAPAIFPSSSKAADQSPSPAEVPSMVAWPINTPEDGLGITKSSNGFVSEFSPPDPPSMV